MHVANGRTLRALWAGIGISVLVIGLAGPASAAPSNDNISNATTIREPLAKNHGVSVAGTNAGASTEPGEPSRSCLEQPSATVWYRYSPRRTHDAFAKAVARQSDPMSPIVAVYRVSSSGLHEIGCDSDSVDVNGAARVNFEAVRGISYLISVDGSHCSDPFTPAEGFDCERSASELFDSLTTGSFTLYVK